MSIFDTLKEKLGGTKTPGEDAPSKVNSIESQPQEDKDLAGWVKSKVEEIRSQANRVSSEGIWMTNVAYLLGYDSVYYDPSQKQFRPIAQNQGYVKRNRIRANLILPGCQNRLARMMKSPPKYDVRPNSQEEDDKDAARLAVECIGMIWDKQQVNRKRINLGMAKQQYGHSYIKVVWDDQLGDPLVDPITGEMLGYEGDIRIDVVSALEVFPDPLAKSFDELGYIIHARVRKLDYFRNHYPDRGDLVKDEGAWLLSSQYEMRINSLSAVGPASSGTSEQMKNAAIELSYYEKRSKKHPNGRHVMCANGVLLKNDSLPCGEFPLAKFDDVIVDGKYYSESLITHARPLQDHYNRVLTKRKEWTDKCLAGKYTAARGHGLTQESINDTTEVVEYDVVPGAPEPSAMNIPVMPAYAYTEAEEAKKQMYEIMGLSEVSRGNLPSASIPAEGMQILLEQDETRIGIETEQDEHAWARVGKLILKNIDKYYVTDRKLKGKGQGMEYFVKNFNGQSIKKNFDVTVIRGSTIPNSKVVKRQEILNAYQQGLLGNPQDPAIREKIWGMLEYGDIGEAWEDYRVDMSQIKKTIVMIENEVQPVINKADNHVLHVTEKNRYRKSDKFDSLSTVSQQLLIQDMDQHVSIASMLANPSLMHPPQMPPPPLSDQQAAQMMGIQGAPPSVGQPPAEPSGAPLAPPPSAGDIAQNQNLQHN